MSPVRYELGFYIPGEGILRSHRRENLKSYNRFPVNTFMTNKENKQQPVLS
jgi:hypothetical protein